MEENLWVDSALCLIIVKSRAVSGQSEGLKEKENPPGEWWTMCMTLFTGWIVEDL